MTTNRFLVLRLAAPLQSWGDVAHDPVRPTRDLPGRSALAGMLASALGWTYRDGDRTTALQDTLRYGVLEERSPRRIRDYQTADLERIGQRGWTRWGVEERSGAARRDTQILSKEYLADGSFLVVLSLLDGAPVSLEEIAEALRAPARPLFLGRKSCVPASPVLVGSVDATSAYRAVLAAREFVDPALQRPGGARYCWYPDGDGPTEGEVIEIWDRRDFATDRFGGARELRRRRLDTEQEDV